MFLYSLICFGVVICNAQNILLRDNGYTGILIAISDNVPYNESLISRIKDVFNRASAALYLATKNRAYFKEITILVPSNWSINATKSTNETFYQANIRVDLPSSQHGDDPFTSQPGGCGEPGEFIHITPDLLLDQATSEKKWGPLEKVIVHEWGHLRWGLFEEYPSSDNIHEHFYISPTTNRLEATRCSMKLEGRNEHRVTRGPCRTDPSTSLPEKDCRFYPSTTSRSGNFSLMYYQYLPQVSQFCDNDELSQDTLHNIEAPNKQNRLCSMKSSWEVMRESVDFAQGANPSQSLLSFNTNVNFRILKRGCDQKIVIVMDVSGSMSSNNYIGKMVSAVKYYLSDVAPTDSWVGLVKYSGSAQRITQQLVKIRDESTRASLVSMVQVVADGGTGIGSGLLLALQMLKDNAASTQSSNNVEGHRMIILTDGEENQPPYIKDVKPTLKAAKVIVDTILFGPAADGQLQSLATETGGESFYSSGSDTSTSLIEAYKKVERSRSCFPSSSTPITIMSRVVTVNLNSSCFGVHVDKFLGVDTTFSFNWLTYGNVNITIISPNKVPKHSSIIYGNSFWYKNNNSYEIGLWSTCLRSTDSSIHLVTTQVESTAAVNIKTGIPVMVRTTIANRNPSFKTESQPVTIYATVSEGYRPVINAHVTAYVESPFAIGSSKPTEIVLRDDGISADIEKDDGIYSAYLLNMASTGKHTVTVITKGTTETRTKVTNVYSKAARMIDIENEVYDQNTTLRPTDEFERLSLVGFIDVKSVADASVDNYPPSRIKDFTFIEASFEKEVATFEWSAVGDDFDSGNASFYELWRAEDFKTLLRSFVNASRVNDSEIITGNLSQPLPPYSKERLTIKATNKNKAFVYAIIAKDESGNAGPVSNFVSVKLVAPETSTTLSPNTDSNSNIWLIVGPTLAFLAIVAAVIAIIFKQCRKQ